MHIIVQLKNYSIENDQFSTSSLFSSLLILVQNFSHRINHFSFGDLVNGQIHPLEAVESVTDVGEFILITREFIIT